MENQEIEQLRKYIGELHIQLHKQTNEKLLVKEELRKVKQELKAIKK